MVLVTTLIFLVIMTMLGLASVQGNSLQERMAGNSRDRQLAFQAAEAALREGEKFADAIALAADTDPSVSVSDALIADQATAISTYKATLSTDKKDQASALYWEAELKKSHATKVTGFYSTNADISLVENPSYLIEVLNLPTGCQTGVGSGNDKVFRVTARGVGASAGSAVVVQSTFCKQYP
jgi:type IV pilus assembly protein PilX